MTMFYQDHDVSITSVAMEIAGRRYALDGLESVWHRRTRRLSRGSYVLATRIGVSSLAIAAVCALVASCAAGWMLTDIRHGEFGRYALAAAAFVVAVLVALMGLGVDPLLELLDRSHEQGHGIHEIWARVDGRDVMVFSTLDAFRFGKIYRALQRAMEHQSHGR